MIFSHAFVEFLCVNEYVYAIDMSKILSIGHIFYIELGKESSIFPLNASNAVQVMALETLQLNNGAATF
jgi:hypothetical protein